MFRSDGDASLQRLRRLTMMNMNTLLPVSVMVMVTLVPPTAPAAIAPNITTHAPNTTTHAPNTTTHAPNTTTHAPNTTTTGHAAVNLEGKMFTMSYGGGATFRSTFTAHSSSVSVCLRYITDYLQTRSPQIFTLSPSTNPLKLSDNNAYTYSLSNYYGTYLLLAPNVNVWSVLRPEIWTRLCVTVDTRTNVAQMFRGSDMSIRKLLPTQYAWSGEPVLDLSGFDGQVTDVHVWDYPLSYSEIYNYMSGGAFGRYHGSVLSWSSVWYTLRGNALLEDAYGQQAEESLGRSKAGRQMKFADVGKSVEKQQL